MSIFSDQDEASERLVRKLSRVPILADNHTCDPEEAAAALIAAEREVARRLGIFLEPTWVFSEGVTQAEIDARTPALPFVVDPGYDYKPEWFQGEGWGHLILRRRPVIEITSYLFVYQPNAQFYQVPLSWIRLDKKYGHVRLLPTGDAASIPLNAFLLSIVGGARAVPNFLRITYRSGIEDINNEYPDLVQFIYRVAMLNYIRDLFPGNSESISSDGMSESRSFDLKSYADGAAGSIEQEYRRWQGFFRGPLMVVA